MFKNDIIIQGGPFTAPVSFEGILSQRMNLVYGRNGSGKSSIARAFREQQAGLEQKDYRLSFDGSGSLPDAVRAHLFVFNEDFIDASVKFSREGLRSIVRIGVSAQLDGPIQAANDKIKELTEQRKPLADEQEKLAGNGADSIQDADNHLKKRLKAPGGFLDRFSRLEGKRCNLTATLLSSVSGTTVKSQGDFSIAGATAKLQAGIDRYMTLQDGTPVFWQAPDLAGVPDLDQINTLLAQIVRPAELSDEERSILDDLSTALASEDMLSRTQKLIIDDDRTYCPLCHQTVSTEHKHNLAQRLLRFRDRQVEDFKVQVDAALGGIRSLSENLPALPESEYRDDLQQGKDAIAGLNGYLDEVCCSLQKKRSNPWTAQPAFQKSDLDALVSACQAAFGRLAADVATYNQSMQEKKMLLDELKKDNVILAIHENLDLILEYNRRVDREDQLAREINRIDRDIADQQGIISQLQGQMDQTDEAREQINRYLGLIFGQKKMRLVNNRKDSYRLQLRKGDTYVDIPPKAISSGERNALALAYFFACVMEKKVKDYAYGDPTLLVIDDPVSSFDAENKAGVISLLTRQSKKVLQGNKASKILILTHDKTTLRELCAQRAEYFKNKNEKDQQTEIYLRLSQGRSLTPVSCKDIVESMEYDAELNAIFNFAASDNPEKDEHCDTMGNTIRRFAESYATRMFRCPWKDLFSKYHHLKRLPDDLQDKISSFAIRPILNSESHGVEDDYEPAELQRAARILLIYMSSASKDHLQAFLYDREKRNTEKMKEVDKWAAEL